MGSIGSQSNDEPAVFFNAFFVVVLSFGLPDSLMFSIELLPSSKFIRLYTNSCVVSPDEKSVVRLPMLA